MTFIRQETPEEACKNLANAISNFLSSIQKLPSLKPTLDLCYIKIENGHQYLFLPNGVKIEKQTKSIVEDYQTAYFSKRTAQIEFLNIDNYFNYKNGKCFYKNIQIPSCLLLSQQTEFETVKKVVLLIDVDFK